jgi:hypothetical protein
LIGKLDFNLSDPKVNQDQLAKLREEKPAIVEMFDGQPVYLVTGQSLWNDRALIGKGGTYFTVSQDNKFITYLTQYTLNAYPYLSRQSCTQIKIWRTNEAPVTLVSRIFWDQLFKLTGLIVSDNQQTPDGREFWHRQASRALGLGIHVYVVDLTDGEKLLVKDITHLRELWAGRDVYGPTKRFREVRLAISKEPLSSDQPSVTTPLV